ncbi:Uncharacterised protein [uncultured archaeon]|nr:Uncharacterised protein [uncultured archaeon]
MVNFLILNWAAGLISALILLLGAFYISSAVDKFKGAMKRALILVVISTFWFAILGFVLSIKALLTISTTSPESYIIEPYIFFFGSIFFTLGAMKFRHELKLLEDFFGIERNAKTFD